MILNDIKQAIIEGNADNVLKYVEAAISEGISIDKITGEALIAGMKEVGDLFEEGEFFVPDMLIAANAMQGAMALLKPLQAGDYSAKGRAVVGTVAGDLHDIGKNLFIMMLEGNGFEVVDLGVDVSPEAFVEAARAHRADIVGLSALLTTTMAAMENTVQLLLETGGDNESRAKIMVGGAPVTEAFAQKIGADGYADNASKAVNIALELVA